MVAKNGHRLISTKTLAHYLPKTRWRREQTTITSKQNTSERQKTSPPLPWDGKLRAHALGRTQKVLQETLPRGTQQPNSTQEPPQKQGGAGSRRQSRPDRTPQKDQKLAHTSPLGWKAQGARSRENPEGAPRDTPAGHTTTKQRTGAPPKTRNTGSRQQSRPNRTPQKDRKLAHHSPWAEGSGRTLSGEPRRCSKRQSRGAHNNQTALRNPPKNTVVQGAEDSRV